MENFDKFIQHTKVVDTFKAQVQESSSSSTVILTHDACQRYVLNLNLILALELIVNKTVNHLNKLVKISFSTDLSYLRHEISTSDSGYTNQ